MQKLDNLYVSELEFDESGMRGPEGKSGDAPSLNIDKVAPYLYKADFKEYSYDLGEIFVRKHYPDTDGSACASVVKGSMLGHNYDERYDDTAEFVVRTPARKGLNSVFGIAAIPGVLTVDMVDSETESELTEEAYDVLPLFLVDGINSKGLAVSIHHMPDVDVDNLSDDSGMCALFAVRYLLDHASTADEAVELLQNQTFWFPKNDQIKARFYLLISDKTSIYNSDLAGNVKKLTSEDLPILTNFRTIGWDGTPETLELHANGIERYNLLADGYNQIETEDDMFNALKSIRYTGVYDTDKENFWYSDYNGDWSELGFGDLTINSAPEDYAAAIQYSRDQFAERQRDGKTMQTVHSVVYDLDKLTMSVMVQEEDKVYHFCMDEMNMIYDEIERAKSAEEAIRNDFADQFYRKSEVDDALHALGESVLEDVAENYHTKTATEDLLTGLHQTIDEETDDKLTHKADAYENEGTAGQVLYRTETGAEWANLPTQLPDVTVEDNNKVLAVEDGEWVATDKYADYFRYVNITVSITSDNGGVPSGGINVTIKNGDTGDVINEAEYLGQPVTFRVPRGMHYVIEQSGKWEGYHHPTPDRIEGAATNDSTAVFTYEAIKVPNTLRELQIIVDGGSASSLKAYVGLQFDDVYTENGVEYPIVWDLKDVISVADGNKELHDAVILEWHYATPTALPFDAPERVEVDLATEPRALEGMYYYGLSGTTYKLLTVNAGDLLPTTYDGVYKNAIRSQDGSIIRRGYSNYGESAVRKWLNSSGDVGEWFEPSHIGDAAPDQVDAIPGFMHGCSEQILSMAKPVAVKYLISASETDEVCDTFFIPSVDEVYGNAYSVAEGTPWQDWVEATEMASPGNGACEGRKIYTVGGSAGQEIGLRTANIGYAYITWDIKPNGSIDGYSNASAARRYAPCCAVYK